MKPSDVSRYVTQSGEYKWDTILSDGVAAAAAAWSLYNSFAPEEESPASAQGS